MMKHTRWLSWLLLVAMIASLGFTTAFANDNETQEPAAVEQTQAPEPTATPEPTEVPDPTEAPTPTPEPTEVPDPTEAPTPTPESTEVPDPTEAPKTTEVPDPTEAPEETPEPKAVVEPNTITAQPESISVVAGTEAVFTVGGSSEIRSCQWQYSRNGRSWYNLSAWSYGSDTTLSFLADRYDNGYQFHVIVTFADGTKVTSDDAVLTVTAPYISSQPESITVAPGGTAEFTVGVEGSVSYVRWQYSRNGGRSWSYLSTWTYGSDVTLRYPAKEAYDGYLFRAYVTCVDGTRLTSAPAMLTVAEPQTEEGSFSQELDTVTVAIEYSAEAGVPENAELAVSETENDSDASAAALERNIQLNDAMLEKYSNFILNDVRYLDIALEVDGEPFEDLQAPVKVTITYNEAMSTDEMLDTGYPVEHIVVHYTDDGPEFLIPEEIKDENGVVKQITFETTSFSEYDDITGQQYDSVGAESEVGGGTKAVSDLTPLGTGKTLTYNNDGTYNLALSVTGDSQTEASTETHSANVLIIYDVSNSMTANRAQNDTGSMGAVGSGTGAAEATYVQLYKSQNQNNPLAEGETYSGTLYYRSDGGWNTYSGQRYSTARRADAAEKALYDMVTDIADGDIQFSLITFSGSANTLVDWTTVSSQITGQLSSTGTYNTAKLSYSQGTGWTAALNEGISQLAKADSDPTYVIFITDGRPSDGDRGNGKEAVQCYYYIDGTSESYTYARRINTYNTADHTYTDASASNTTLFGIYAYGLQADYLDDVVYYAKNGSHRSSIASTTDTDGVTDQYFKAGSTQALQDAIETIKQNIKSSLDYGGVTYDDGIATDTTTTTLSTSVGGALTGLTYTVTNGDTTVYTVTTDAAGNVLFNIGGTEYSSAKGTFKFSETDTTSYEYYYAVDSSGNALTFTVGSGDTARTYQYKMGLATFTDGDLNWDLTGIGGLVGGYTYTLSFTVWPVQEAYDIAADLNNGLTTYTWDTSLSTYEDLTSTKGYEKGGVSGYPNIVKYPNGTYAVLTNTSQEVTYYVVNTEEVDGVPTTTYDGPNHTTPTAPPPMDLVGSSIPMVKEWLVSLSPSELDEWVAKGNTLTLRVTVDNSKYIDYVFPSESMETTTDESGNVTWEQSCAIAPGILLERDKAVAEGIITKTGENYNYGNYNTVVMDGKTYVILGEGHDYTVEEIAGSDLHFEFSTQVYHPMLVDGKLQNIEFSADKTTATVKDANLTEFKGTNKLKGGISIYKEVYGSDYKEEDAEPIDSTDEFAFKVTLWSEDANGNKSPVYTTEDQFENSSPKSGSFGYRVYQSFSATAVDDTHWTIVNDDGETITITKVGDDKYTGSDNNSYSKSGDNFILTVQRDAIYSGTSPAQVTVGTETTVMTFTMQANQYCYIVNVPAGTKYTVEELQSDSSAYNHFYSSVSVLEGDDTTGLYEVVEEKELEGDATALTDHMVDGYVSANSSSKVIFKNWAGYFYVYHSATNAVEKISFADERVTGAYDASTGKYVYSFNIVEETGRSSADSLITAVLATGENVVSGSYDFTGDYLYGGYFKAYGGIGGYTGTAATDDAKIRSLSYDDTGWASDSSGKKYDESQALEGLWLRANAYKATDGVGTAMHPVADGVYYIKEVSTKFLHPFMSLIYNEDSEIILDIALITAVDDNVLYSAGYTVNNGETTYYYGTVSKQFDVYKQGAWKATYYVKDTNSAFGDNQKGYLVSVGGSRFLPYGSDENITVANVKSNYVLTPTWKTLDQVLVNGIVYRTVETNDMVHVDIGELKRLTWTDTNKNMTE